MPEKKMSFEKAIARMEKINALLSEGEVSLDEGMKLYAEGAALAAFCKTELEKAKKAVEEADSDE